MNPCPRHPTTPLRREESRYGDVGVCPLCDHAVPWRDESRVITPPTPQKGNKYGAQACEYNGLKFGSKKELSRWKDLELMEKAGAITGLEPHPSWELVVNDVRIGRFTADSKYTQGGELIVEDVKSSATAKARDYPLRKKLMVALFGITVKEY